MCDRYPEINKFLQMLHARRISSFLVTNAQFPEAIHSLTPVCQLYVSVDAASKVGSGNHNSSRLIARVGPLL